MKKYILHILIIITLIGFFTPATQVRAAGDDDGTAVGASLNQATSNAQANTPTNSSTTTDPYYHLLAPLPCPNGGAGCDSNKQLSQYDPRSVAGQPTSLGNYLNPMITIFIGICAVLAVIMIVMGGIEYMTSELPGLKGEGKQKIINAIFGLVLALGAWTLLYTINPDLLKSDITLKDATVTVTQQNFAASPSTYIVPLGKTGQTSGTNCDENAIAASNQTASAGLSDTQIHTLACIGGIESGCNSVQNYKWNKGSSAYGPFQITLQGNANCFENSVCRQAAGVSGPLNCATGFRNGNPISDSPIVAQCQKAADNFTCSVAAAACLIKQSPNYSPWNANSNLSKCL
jgi:type IV secretory pathway VirB2 component (pilin)